MISELMIRDKELHQAFDNFGLKLKFYDYSSGLEINNLAESNTLSGGIVGDMPALLAAANLDAKIMSIIEYGLLSIHAQQSVLMNDFKNQTFVTTKHSDAHLMILEALEIFPAKNQKAKIIFDSPFAAGDRLEQGEEVLFSTWEPLSTALLKKYPKQMVVYRSIGTGFFYVTAQFMEEHPTLVQALYMAQYRAQNYMLASKRNILHSARLALKKCR